MSRMESDEFYVDLKEIEDMVNLSTTQTQITFPNQNLGSLDFFVDEANDDYENESDVDWNSNYPGYLNETAVFGPGATSFWQPKRKRRRGERKAKRTFDDMDREDEEKFIEANSLCLQGEYSSSLDILLDLSKKYPRAKEVYESIANVHELLGNDFQQIKYMALGAIYTRMKNVTRETLNVWSNISRRCVDLGLYNHAIAAANKILSRQDAALFKEVNIYKSIALLHLNQEDLSRKALRIGLRKYSECSTYLVDYGLACEECGRNDLALQHYILYVVYCLGYKNLPSELEYFIYFPHLSDIKLVTNFERESHMRSLDGELNMEFIDVQQFFTAIERISVLCLSFGEHFIHRSSNRNGSKGSHSIVVASLIDLCFGYLERLRNQTFRREDHSILQAPMMLGIMYGIAKMRLNSDILMALKIVNPLLQSLSINRKSLITSIANKTLEHGEYILNFPLIIHQIRIVEELANIGMVTRATRLALELFDEIYCLGTSDHFIQQPQHTEKLVDALTCIGNVLLSICERDDSKSVKLDNDVTIESVFRTGIRAYDLAIHMDVSCSALPLYVNYGNILLKLMNPANANRFANEFDHSESLKVLLVIADRLNILFENRVNVYKRNMIFCNDEKNGKRFSPKKISQNLQDINDDNDDDEANDDSNFELKEACVEEENVYEPCDENQLGVEMTSSRRVNVFAQKLAKSASFFDIDESSVTYKDDELELLNLTSSDMKLLFKCILIWIRILAKLKRDKVRTIVLFLPVLLSFSHFCDKNFTKKLSLLLANDLFDLIKCLNIATSEIETSGGNQTDKSIDSKIMEDNPPESDASNFDTTMKPSLIHKINEPSDCFKLIIETFNRVNRIKLKSAKEFFYRVPLHLIASKTEVIAMMAGDSSVSQVDIKEFVEHVQKKDVDSQKNDCSLCIDLLGFVYSITIFNDFYGSVEFIEEIVTLTEIISSYLVEMGLQSLSEKINDAIRSLNMLPSAEPDAKETKPTNSIDSDSIPLIEESETEQSLSKAETIATDSFDISSSLPADSSSSLKKKPRFSKSENSDEFIANSWGKAFVQAAAEISKDTTLAAVNFLTEPSNVEKANLLVKAVMKASLSTETQAIDAVFNRSYFEQRLQVSLLPKVAPQSPISFMLLGHQKIFNRRIAEALVHYLDAFCLDTSQPLISLVTAVLLLQLAFHRSVAQREHFGIKSLLFFEHYRIQRLEHIRVVKRCESRQNNEEINQVSSLNTSQQSTIRHESILQEIFYNIGRMCMDIGSQQSAATSFYNALHIQDDYSSCHGAARPRKDGFGSIKYPVVDDTKVVSIHPADILPLTRQAAFNLTLILKQSGAYEEALRIMIRYLTV